MPCIKHLLKARRHSKECAYLEIETSFFAAFVTSVFAQKVIYTFYLHSKTSFCRTVSFMIQNKVGVLEAKTMLHEKHTDFRKLLPLLLIAGKQIRYPKV